MPANVSATGRDDEIRLGQIHLADRSDRLRNGAIVLPEGRRGETHLRPVANPFVNKAKKNQKENDSTAFARLPDGQTHFSFVLRG